MNVSTPVVPLFLAVILAGCPGNDVPDTGEAAAGAQLDPEQQMRGTLENLVRAQARYHERHGRYSADAGELLENYGFQPVGDTHAVISFGEPGPEWRYLASATHPRSQVTCEVVHGRPGPDEPQYTGQIDCAAP
jgi:hypothetical protein